MGENADTEADEPKKMDAVDLLMLFVEKKCLIPGCFSQFAERDEFDGQFALFCKEHSIEPPSSRVLALILAKVTGAKPGIVPVYRGIVMKESGSDA